MIFVIGGTREARELATKLAALGYGVVVSYATPYGAKMVDEGKDVRAVWGKLTPSRLRQIIEQYGVDMIIDASHPFATEITRMARNEARLMGLEYVRFYRKKTDFPQSSLIRVARSWQDAAKLAFSLGNIVFLTIGTKNLEWFVKEKKPYQRIIAKVLPTSEAIDICRENNIPMRDIIAMMGPNSCELIKALLKETDAEVLVTKESGFAGGVSEKIQAALDAGIPCVVVERPDEDEEGVFTEIHEVIEYVKEVFEK